MCVSSEANLHGVGNRFVPRLAGHAEIPSFRSRLRIMSRLGAIPCAMKSKHIAGLWILSGIVPLACVVLGDWLLQRATECRSVFDVEPGTGVTLVLLAASPFLVLAVMAPVWGRTEVEGGATALVHASVTGCVVTAGIWGLFDYEVFLYRERDLPTGANIGLGLVLLVSPLLVGGAMTAAYRLSKNVVARRKRVGGVQ